MPKETEGINVWLHCYVFRATYILMSYLASGEGGTVLLVPAFCSLDPRWWESSTVKWRKKEIWAKVEGAILRSHASTYEHFDTWQDLTSKQELKTAPVLAGFVYFQWGWLSFAANISFLFSVPKKKNIPGRGNISLSSFYHSLLKASLCITDSWGLRSVAGVQGVIVGQWQWEVSKF